MASQAPEVTTRFLSGSQARPFSRDSFSARPRRSSGMPALGVYFVRPSSRAR